MPEAARMTARARPLRRALCASLLGLLASCDPGPAHLTIPDTPAGRVLSSWLDAYNARDSAALDAYARVHEPRMSTPNELSLRAESGRWDVASIERSAPLHLEVTLRTRPDSETHVDHATAFAVVDMTDSASGSATRNVTILGKGSPTAIRRIDASERSVTIDSLAAKVDRNYVAPTVAQAIVDSLRARRTRGAYDSLDTEIRLARRLNRDLLELGGDGQLGVEYAWQIPLPPPPSMAHCGVDKPSVLGGNVGYLRFIGFSDPDVPCGHEVSMAIDSLAGTRALILDLRDAGEGSSSMMAYVASYLVGSCTHLDDTWERRSGTTEQRWTHDGLPGAAFGASKPLFLLTSAHTLATGEELVYALRRTREVVVVGETTGGEARSTAIGQIGAHLLLRVPIARALDPVSGTSWQGVGIAPDVRVRASSALDTAKRLIQSGVVPPSVVARRVQAHSSAADAGHASIDWKIAGTAQPPRSLRGIRFEVDTTGLALDGHPDDLARLAGRVEFAHGRGRFDVMAVRTAPVVALNGIVLGVPKARPGDYYLFDNTGFVLVQPSTRSFSPGVFVRADFNHTGALLPGAFLMRDTPLRREGVAPDAAGSRQHVVGSVHWHMQPSNGSLYARGWLELVDVPAIETGVARWFEVAAALATAPAGLRPILLHGLEVTSVVLLRPRAAHESTLTYPVTLAPLHLADADVAPDRLVLPSGYRETPWPAGSRVSSPPSSSPTAAHWRTLESAVSQYGRAACRSAWLPEISAAALPVNREQKPRVSASVDPSR